MSTMTLPTLHPTMHAALFYQPGDVRYETVPTPQPGPGELIIQVNAALTCGTDLKAYRRGHPVLLKNFPCPFGHECAGVVAAVGDGVEGFTVGDRVVAANSAPCMECFFCRKEDYNLCENLDLLNGAYADYIRIPARIVQRNTLHIPDGVPFDAAAFAEPLAVSLRGIEACNIQPGEHVAVIGLGAIGQMLMRLAKLQGAHVTGLGRNSLKRRMGKEFAQADCVLDMTEHTDAAAIVSQFTPEGRGFDVVIEAVGLPQMWHMAIDMVRRGGLVNLFGGCESGSRLEVDTRRLHYDEITLVSPFHHTPRHFRQALSLIASGEVDPRPLITQVRPMRDVVEALGLVADGQAIKVLLTPEQVS